MPTIPSNLNIRRARENDLPEMARVHLASYPGMNLTLQERIEHFRTNPRLSLEDYWVCEKGERLVGLFALYNFNIFRLGVLIPAGGIGSVAVAPESRREKIAYSMMTRAVEIMDQNSVPLSILYPFRHGFYHGLGWGIIGRVKLYRFSPSSLPDFPERASVFPVTTTEEQEEVMACYADFAGHRNGLVRRGDPQWFENIFKNAVCYAYREPTSREVEGYITFRYRPYPSNVAFVSTDIEVWDFVYNSQRALHGLLGFLSTQRDQVKIVIFPNQSGLPLEQILSEPRMPDGRHDWLFGAETAHLGCSLMGRVVTLRRALKATGKLGDGSGKLILKIKDDIHPANSSPLTLDIDRGKVEILKQGTASITLSANIATFSALYWGALNISEAILLGLAEVEGKGEMSFLKRIFSVPKPMCLDFF